MSWTDAYRRLARTRSRARLDRGAAAAPDPASREADACASVDPAPAPPDPPPAGAGDGETARRLIRERIDAWLDRLLEDEPAPEGIDAAILAAAVAAEPDDGADDPDPAPGGPAPDQAAMWSALTTLGQEVKLQGRTFRSLEERLSQLLTWTDRLPRLEDAQREVAQSVTALGDETRAAREAASREQVRAHEEDHELLAVLHDLYGRLRRGLSASSRALDRLPPETPRRRWLGRRGRRAGGGPAEARAAIEALQEGYALSIETLLDALRRRRITPVGVEGEPFDPHLMVASNVVASATAPPGTVLEVYEPGFVRDEDVLRPARVKVAGAAGGPVVPAPTDSERDER